MPWELVVVDNGSTDATPDIVQAFEPRLPLRLVDVPARGLAGARNAGVAAARYTDIAHCDADDEVTDGWLSAIVTCLRSAPLVSGPLDEVTLNAANPWQRPRLPAGELPVALGHRRYGVGANIAYRWDVVAAIGGWDEEFRTAADDIDFCWRALEAGFEIGFCEEMVVRYRHRDTARGLARQYRRYGIADPLLLKRHKAFGVTRRPLRRVLRHWRALLGDLPAVVRDREERAGWIAMVSWLMGRVLGSIRHRSLLL